MAKGLKVLILDSANNSVITCDATVTGDKIVFTTPCLGEMLLVADQNASFPWWIILITVVVLAAIAVLVWFLVIRKKKAFQDDEQPAEDYDSVLNGLAEDKRTKDNKLTKDAEDITQTKKSKKDDSADKKAKDAK